MFIKGSVQNDDHADNDDRERDAEYGEIVLRKNHPTNASVC